MQRMLWAALTAFAVSLIIGPTVIKLLTKLKIGQQVYSKAPETHKAKQGMPTMGGLMFAIISVALAFTFRTGSFQWKSDIPAAIALFAILNLAMGFADDFLKIRRKANQGGLSEKQKTIGQIIVAAAFSWYCWRHPDIGSSIRLPFITTEFNLSWAYIPVMTFVIYCTLNAANLLDGLDGLLASVSICMFATFGIFALMFAGQMGASQTQAQTINIATMCAALTGAMMGYLRYNAYPAQMMMGDTGSMYIGAVFVAVGMAIRVPLWIPFAGVMMVVSLVSTFAQRMYFKATHGKRIFKNSPYHHHLEMMGMAESRIVSMYVLITVLFCMLCFLALPLKV